MKNSTLVLAVTLLIANSMALGAARSDSNSDAVSIDPPTGSKNCGFAVSGHITSPRRVALSYGFFFRTEANIVTSLHRAQIVKNILFSGPGTQQVTASSAEHGDNSLFRQKKFVQVQLKIWKLLLLDPRRIGTKEWDDVLAAPLAESVWVDVPATSAGCAQMMPAAESLLPTPGDSPTPPNPAPPGPSPAPKLIKRLPIQHAP